MTIDEAIESLEWELGNGDFAPGSPYENAIKLGIEALKEVQCFRKDPDHYKLELLLGETEE